MVTSSQHATSSEDVSVMIVDDSAVVRGMISRHLKDLPGVQITASLANGEMAVNHIMHTPVDVVVLDIEMPVMDGMTALPKILEQAPETKVIMASTLTLRNAEVSMRALEMGAADYVPKPSSARDKEASAIFFRDLASKITALAPAGKQAGLRIQESTQKTATASSTLPPVRRQAPIAAGRLVTPTFRPQALAIASSTGGPQALLDVFKQLKGKLSSVPIFITQHMPPTFTKILAQHLGTACGRDCHEAEDGEPVKPGVIYLAPGDYHMMPVLKDGHPVITLDHGPEVNFCRPAADPMIKGLVDIYGNKLLLLVLTGMGQDGLGGARALYERGGFVVAQDKETSVVWGMPGAVAENNLTKALLPLGRIAPYVLTAFGEAT